MAKRTATNELTDRNWDEEEEPEEAGQFVQASDDVIKGRQIKKAKRRGAAGSSEEGSSVFSGFSGFKSISSGTTAKPGLSAFKEKAKNGSNTDVNNSSKTENGKTDKSESDYLANLKSLNESVVTWIKQHVDKNPFCILSPIFKDYEKHLEELEKEKREKANSAGASKQEQESKPKESTGSGFTFSTNGTSGSSFGAFGSTGNFNFGSTAPTTTTASSGFSFGKATTSTSSDFSAATTATTGFSFGSKTATSGFSFGASTVATASTSSSQAKTGDDEEEYVPPTVEVSEVQEEGAFYTKRGKLFYQKEGKWTEKGVGNVHLKKVDEKVQLVMRADTNLGNILLNIILSEGIPVKKQGKNNIFFVCVPNPPFDAKAEENTPVPILIRVKTSEDAEELVAKVEENRK